MNPDSMKAILADYILEKHLPGESAEALSEVEGLISEGILDSMASLMLVSFVEEQFNVSIPAHHIDAEHLDSLNRIVETIQENNTQA